MKIPGFVQFGILISCLKLLLLNSYHSTDFEVHRNWLAITHSLPISEWYYEETSEWTLDYPPFFAWFEYVLSNAAVYFDDQMLNVDNLKYASEKTILFQRFSVIFLDFLLLYAISKFYRQYYKKDGSIKFFLLVGIFSNAGLLLVDHIHFQYNGFLFSMLLMSIADMQQQRYLLSSFWFAVLLNFKHIFLYIAPCYFVYLLRHYCFGKRNNELKGLFRLLGADVRQLKILNLFKLASIVICVFAVSFGPFICMKQGPQLLSRLFPVKRGLCHAYWAANFWAIYSSIDKILVIIGPKFGLLNKTESVASMTGGLVAQQSFTAFPNIPPFVTGLVTITFMLPALLKVWYRPHQVRTFLPCLSLCAYVSFLFGYHVHEKAILMVVLPMTLLAIMSPKYTRVFVILSITGHYALFPLLFQQAETPLKIIILILPTLITLVLLKKIHREKTKQFCIPFLTWYESIYLYGLVPLYIYTEFGHYLLGLNMRLPFIPLMMTSLYCSIGIIWSWILLYVDFIWTDKIDERAEKEQKS